jgi:RNA polymerase sigma factor (sigma-70 family)
MFPFVFAALTFINLITVLALFLAFAEKPVFEVSDGPEQDHTISFASRFEDKGKRHRSSRSRAGSQPLDRRQAYELLFQKKTVASVWRWLERLCIPLRDRRDASQEVFLEAHKSFHRYNPLLARPERWLNQIAVHMASHYHNRAVNRREVLKAEGFFEEEDAGPGMDEQIEREETRLRLLELLQRVDPKLRYVLVEHDLNHIPMREVAEQLGIKVTTAYKWRARALTALADEIHRREPEK